MPTRTLTDLEQRMLDYAEQHPRLQGLPHVIPEFGWREPAYLLRLFRLVDDTAALAVRPMLVKRIQRVRDERVQARTAHTFNRDLIALQPRSAG
jgi:hypothetical protein